MSDFFELTLVNKTESDIVNRFVFILQVCIRRHCIFFFSNKECAKKISTRRIYYNYGCLLSSTCTFYFRNEKLLVIFCGS